MRTGTFSFRAFAWSLMAAICCLFPSTRKTRWRTRCGSRRSASSNAFPIIAGMSSVTEADTHLSRAAGPGAGGRGGDVLRLAGRRGEVGDGDDLGHLLDPGMRPVALARAVLRPHR